MTPGHPLPGALLCIPEYVPDAGHEDRWTHPGPFYAVVSMEWVGVVTSQPRLGLPLSGCGIWTAGNTTSIVVTPLPSSPSLPTPALRLRPSSLSGSVISRQSSCHLVCPLVSAPHPRLVPASLSQQEPGKAYQGRPGISQPASGPGRAPPACRDSSNSLSELWGRRPLQPLRPSALHRKGILFFKNLRISPATVEATMRTGGRVPAKRKPSVDLEQPQAPPSTLRTKCEEHRPSSHEAAQSARALDRPESRHVGESFNGTMYAVTAPPPPQLAVFKKTPSADLLFTHDERELFDFLAEDVSDMRI
ncbi:hypothetical protein B0H14DRAFT_2590288 [Mycena olivaceomarginata]|nr:hypothetical protein B0H14DRAFT_2590288 [Mycena olivaceomarginata]